MTETKLVAVLHFSDGSKYDVPGVFGSEEDASLKVEELLAQEYLREQKNDTLTTWRTSQAVRWEVKPEPWAGSPATGGVPPPAVLSSLRRG